MEPIEQFNENFDVKKPKKKGLIIGGIVAAVIIVALVLVYFLVFTNPKFIFNKAIDKLLAIDSEQYDSVKINTEIKASVEAEDTTYEAQLAEVEKYKVKFGAQMDFKDKKEIVDLGLAYDNQSVIDAQLYYNDGEMYTYLEGLFDKYIQIDMDEETKNQMDEIFEIATSEEDIEDSKKAVAILKDELKAQINEKGEFEKTKETIDVGDDEEKVTKTTLKLSQKELYSVAADMCLNLADNDEFIDYLGEADLAKALEEVAEMIKNEEANNKNYVKISLYTKGLLNNKLVAVDVEIYSAVDSSTAVVSIVKEDEGVFSYKISAKGSGIKMDLVNGKVEIEKDKDSKEQQAGKAIITAEVIETGSAKLEIDYSVEFNNGIDKIDTTNSVNINNLTETDALAIATKLMERPVIGDLIKERNSLYEQSQEAADEIEKAQIYEAISLAKTELFADYYGGQIEITEEKVKETVEEFLYEPYDIKVTKTQEKLEFIITVEGMELDGVSNVIDFSNI